MAALRSEDFPGGPPGRARRGELGAAPAGPPGASSTSRSATPSARSGSGRGRAGGPRSDVVGPAIEGHPDFPNRTNVSWYAELEPGRRARIRARIFERGVGETLSSGTGASGAAVAYVLGAGARPPGQPAGVRVTVVLDGGELEVEVGEDLHVHLSGWALPVFEGRLSEELREGVACEGAG